MIETDIATAQKTAVEAKAIAEEARSLARTALASLAASTGTDPTRTAGYVKTGDYDEIGAWLDTLPAGSVVTDRDGDRWTRKTDAPRGWAFKDGRANSSGRDFAPYRPITVVEVPAAPVPAPIAVGDKVRIVATAPWGAGYCLDGLTGEVTQVDREHYSGTKGYRVRLSERSTSGHTVGDLISAGTVERLPEPSSAPAALVLSAKYGDREVEIEPGSYGSDLRLIVRNNTDGDHTDRFAYLTPEMARTVAASLVAAADASAASAR